MEPDHVAFQQAPSLDSVSDTIPTDFAPGQGPWGPDGFADSVDVPRGDWFLGWRRPWPATLTVLVPALNEAHGLRYVIPEIPTSRLKARGLTVSVLVVDGHSTDGTQDLAKALGARVIVQSGRGKGNAVREAIPKVEADYAVMIDGDGTYPTEAIVDLVRKLDEGYDVVSGSRLSGKIEPGAMSRSHRIGNRLLTMIANVLHAPARTSDVCTGLWAFRVDALRRLKLSADGFSLEAEIFAETARNGLRYAEVPIAYKRRKGNAKLSWDDGLGIALTLFRRRIARAGPSTRP